MIIFQIDYFEVRKLPVFILFDGGAVYSRPFVNLVRMRKTFGMMIINIHTMSMLVTSILVTILQVKYFESVK
jgi:hypothetical protein